MLVSTKGRYALRIMIDLAEHQRDGYIPLKETAGRQGISEKYLEGIIKILVKDKMLTGVRGKGGGIQTYQITGSVYSRKYPAPYGRLPCPCILSGIPGRTFLRAHGLLPYTPHVERLGSPDQQLLRQYHSC